MGSDQPLHYFAFPRFEGAAAGQIHCVSHGEAKFWAGLTYAAKRLYIVGAYHFNPRTNHFQFQDFVN